jgi:hypothetical protein
LKLPADILTELINGVRAVVLSGKVDINLHWRSLGEKPHLLPERSRILTGVFDQELGIA